MKSSILYSVDKINRKLEAVNTPVFEVAELMCRGRRNGKDRSRKGRVLLEAEDR